MECSRCSTKISPSPEVLSARKNNSKSTPLVLAFILRPSFRHPSVTPVCLTFLPEVLAEQKASSSPPPPPQPTANPPPDILSAVMTSLSSSLAVPLDSSQSLLHVDWSPSGPSPLFHCSASPGRMSQLVLLAPHAQVQPHPAPPPRPHLHCPTHTLPHNSDPFCPRSQPDADQLHRWS